MPDETARRFAEHEARLTAQDRHATASDSRSDGQDVRSDSQDARADDRERVDGAWRVASDERSDWQDKINRNRYRKLGYGIRSLALGCGAGLLCLAIAIPVTVHAAQNANDAASSANKAAACSNLLLGSVAAQAIDPDATALHCDTAVADRLITRGKARDAALAQTQQQIVVDACALLMLLPGAKTSPEVVRFRADFGCAR